jgi:hypothetical protein
MPHGEGTAVAVDQQDVKLVVIDFPTREIVYGSYMRRNPVSTCPVSPVQLHVGDLQELEQEARLAPKTTPGIGIRNKSDPGNAAGSLVGRI